MFCESCDSEKNKQTLHTKKLFNISYRLAYSIPGISSSHTLCGLGVFWAQHQTLEQTGFQVSTWLNFCVKFLTCLAQQVYICHETVTKNVPWLKWRETSCNLWARITIISYICHLLKGLWSKCVLNRVHGNGYAQRHACVNAHSHLPKLVPLMSYESSVFKLDRTCTTSEDQHHALIQK